MKAKPPVEDEELVTIAKYCMETGDTDPAIRARIASGKWPEGVYFYRRDRRIRLIRKKCDAWWSEQKKKR